MKNKCNHNVENLIELPRINDERGNLSIVEAQRHVPFNISRVYWIYDVPGGQIRGSHAFRNQHEVIIALSGSFDVILHDGAEERKYTLNRSYKALYIPNMMWRTLENFSTNSVCLVLSSALYDESDYIRDFILFKEEVLRSVDMCLDLKTISSQKRNLLKPQYNTIYDCSLMEFPIVKNRMGNITAINNQQDIPFDIERVFYIYDIPGGAERGMHAHKLCHQVLVAVSGSFKVELDDGQNKKVVNLNHPKFGLYIPPGVWAKEKEYSSGAVCLVLTSEKYSSDDYINTYTEFIKYRQDADRDL